MTAESGRADYEQIASRYDEDRQHRRTPADVSLARLLERGSARVTVLDLACGTGRYLATQIDCFKDRALRCFGVDLSPAMLSSARARLPGGRLVCATAERLPFAAAAFDYVHSGWAFHHFADKRTAIEEVARILRPGGRFTIQNIEPWSMPRWWVYQWFDGTREADQRRFWSVHALTDALRRHGLSVAVTIDHSVGSLPAVDALRRAEARVISQLAILDRAKYGDGLRRLQAKTAADPEATIESELATLTVTAIAERMPSDPPPQLGSSRSRPISP